MRVADDYRWGRIIRQITISFHCGPPRMQFTPVNCTKEQLLGEAVCKCYRIKRHKETEKESLFIFRMEMDGLKNHYMQNSE